MRSKNALHPFVPLEHKRDAYGFAVRPQHVQRYREYSSIYKEEEEERSERWKTFIGRISESAELPINRDEPQNKDVDKTSINDTVKDENTALPNDSNFENVDLTEDQELPENSDAPAAQEKKVHRIQIWSDVRPSLHVIEDMMSVRIRKRNNASSRENGSEAGKNHPPAEEPKFVKGASEEDSEEEFYDVERSDLAQDIPSSENVGSSAKGVVNDAFLLDSPWKEELEVLIRGGVPMALRGELWQAFVGVKARRQEKYYHNLLSRESDCGDVNQEKDHAGDQSNGTIGTCEKWKGQIEKDLPRTFPGHPALDEDGRNALRRILIAYARHNPSVGYCQAMNFFAGLLLLLMPEENAFWTLVGVLDDYFGGYYSEDMIECQVDQLVFEELVRERFPKLVNHLDYLGVEITWITGPWFLSIFMNMLPWESVLRVWDVLLFEGNRVMLFKTALSLMELYGPALVTTKDAGDAVTLLQSLAGSTFDSSQLVLTACMGYQNVHETRLKELREKHRPSILAMIEERSKGLQAWKSSTGLASKLYNFKHDNKPKVADEQTNGDSAHLESGSSSPGDYTMSMQGGVEVDPGLDLQEQVVWLKVELCKLLEEKRSAELRAEELETALMEMVRQDNRRQLSAKVEQLEQEVSDIHRVLSDKQEQESAMIQVLMRVEQEQKVTEDARQFAEQDAAAQRYAAQVLQDKYEEAMATLATMEKRAVMAESMLEATLQYQSGQVKALSSPRSVVQGDSIAARNGQENVSEPAGRKISLLSRWRDKNKGKPAEESNETKSSADEVPTPVIERREINGHQTEVQASTA